MLPHVPVPNTLVNLLAFSYDGDIWTVPAEGGRQLAGVVGRVFSPANRVEMHREDAQRSDRRLLSAYPCFIRVRPWFRYQEEWQVRVNRPCRTDDLRIQDSRVGCDRAIVQVISAVERQPILAGAGEIQRRG